MKDALERWRTTRSTKLANIVCCTDDAAWRANLVDIEGKLVSWAKPRIEKLPDDPRTTVFLVKMMAQAEWRTEKSRPLWTYVFARLVKLRDVRCSGALRAIAANPPDFFQPKTTAWIATEAARIADKLDKISLPRDDARTKKIIAAHDVELPDGGFFPVASTDKLDGLLAQVWAAPDDLELRAVIGDALQELGDPRGELVALQLRKKPAKIAAFLEEHEETLAGPIARIAPINGVRFRYTAGFLTWVKIGTFYATPHDWAHAATTPHWATVREIELVGPVKPTWFKAWWDPERLRSLVRIVVGNAILVRTGDTWRFEREATAPNKLLAALARVLL